MGSTSSLIRSPRVSPAGSVTSTHKTIEAMLAEERLKNASVVKLLLLGPSESGKSTILKQMRILHSNGFSDEELRLHMPEIFKDLLQDLVEVAVFLQDKNDFAEVQSHKYLQEAIFESQHAIPRMSANLIKGVLALLKDPGVAAFKETFENCGTYGSCYFLKNADRICAVDYLPTPTDMLNLRIQTTGVVETCFTIKNICFKVIDVAGQKALRRKWIHCFDDARAVLFLCALSDYNMLMKEDHTTNRMTDALQLCAGVFNSKWFTKSSLILFLNKKDMFEQKLKTIPLNKYFGDYNGDNSYEDAVMYFERKFSEICGQGAKHIYKHRTCATDTNQMKLVIDSCIDMIITANISASGIA